MLRSGVVFHMAVIGKFKDTHDFSVDQIEQWITTCWITNEEITVEKVGKLFFSFTAPMRITWITH